MNHIRPYHLIICLAITALLSSCAAKDDFAGVEYAPQMYHSTPYEPLSQVTDKSQGEWLDSNPEDEHGEFYNSNPYNPHRMTMRKPVANTVRTNPNRNYLRELPYRLEKDSLDAAAAVKSPVADSPEALKEGKALYDRFCEHCHGEKGLGNGLVGQVYLGVPAYNSAAIKDKPEGHIFHVITHGKGRMGAHASQISVEDRWKIVKYVQKLQAQ
ncbi:MAG: cytochrome c [Bacteroidota bacterium]